MGGKFTLFLALVALLLAPLGCASGPSGAPPDGVVIRDVPFFSQEAYQCGPTSLATVMDYWYGKMGMTDKWTTPEQIAAAIYSPSAGGVLGLDLEVYARKHGFETEQYSGSLDDLRTRVDRGVPLIIFVDYGLLVYEVNHFMVVTGYTRDGVIVNSGRREGQRVSMRELAKIWKRNHYWTLALRPSA
ncbi:MAG: C39 family peptidase [Syntrophorhabdales bacterium]|jgi:predicted double-glycine peptidase